MPLGWHDPIRTPCTYRLERVSCGKKACGKCHGIEPAHGPYWYAYWETGGRLTPRMSKRYIGKARADATPEDLRALFERRQAARSDAARRRGTSSGGTSSGGTSSGGASSGGASGGGASSGGTSSGGASNGGTSSGGASSGGASSGGVSSGASSRRSGRASSDCFNSRRPPPLADDFATIGSRIGVPFETARRAYYAAISAAHPDRGGSDEQAKCINAAWERIRRHYGRR